MHASLQKILDMPSNQIDRTPKPPPQGWYIASVEGQPEEGESSGEKKTPFYAFNQRLLDVYKDVDKKELEEFLTGLDGSTKSLQDCTVRNVYYVTEKSVGRLLTFLDHLEGLRPSDVVKEKASVKRRLSEAVGRSCLIHIRHKPWLNGEGVSAEVDQTMIYDED